MGLTKIAAYAALVLMFSVARLNAAEDNARQIGTEFNNDYKLNASVAEYEYMGKKVAQAHSGKSVEEVLITCAEVAMKKAQYTAKDIRTVLALAKSMKANDEKLFTANVTGTSVFAAMQIHADMLECAMPASVQEVGR